MEATLLLVLAAYGGIRLFIDLASGFTDQMRSQFGK